MRKRKHRSRTVYASPLARRSDIDPAPPGRSFAFAVEPLIDKLAARHVAERRHRTEASEPSRAARDAARDTLADALHYQRRRGHRRQVDALLAALASDGGAMLATYADAHEDYRADVLRALVAWAETVERRRVDDPATLAMLAGGYLERGVSNALRRRVLRLPIDHPDAAELREEARRAGNASRLDLVTGLALASEAAELHPGPSPLDLLLADHAADPGNDPSSAERGDDAPATDEQPASAVSTRPADTATEGNPDR